MFGVVLPAFSLSETLAHFLLGGFGQLCGYTLPYYLIILYDRLLLVTQIPCSIYNLLFAFDHWLAALLFSFVALLRKYHWFFELDSVYFLVCMYL
jgi:hypothetical protein